MNNVYLFKQSNLADFYLDLFRVLDWDWVDVRNGAFQAQGISDNDFCNSNGSENG